jgi:glycosyltransferase involved in cell wall biosynthesis
MKVFLNLLFLTHQGGLAGSTYSIAYLADGLASRGHSVYVGCPPDSLLNKLLQNSRAKTIAMEIRHKLDYRNMVQIRDICKKHDIDIINAQSGKDRYTSIFSKIHFSFSASVIHTRRQVPKSIGFFLQNRIYTKFTQKIIAVSNGVKEELIQLGIPEKHIVVIHNGTPLEKYKLKNIAVLRDLKARYNIYSSDTVVGCVARYKQQDQLLKALHYIDRPLKVVFVGIHEKEEFRQLTKGLIKKHTLIYTGPISPTEVLYFYKLFRIKILPSVTEGLSQALLESMALGVPVIATEASGNVDLIKNGINGFLFKNNDIRDLAHKIEILLDNKNLSKSFIAAGEKTALQDFEIKKTLDKYESFFLNIKGQKESSLLPENDFFLCPVN